MNIFGLQDSHTSHLDLGLCLKGHNSILDSVGQHTENQVVFGHEIDVQFFRRAN